MSPSQFCVNLKVCTAKSPQIFPQNKIRSLMLVCDFFEGEFTAMSVSKTMHECCFQSYNSASTTSSLQPVILRLSLLIPCLVHTSGKKWWTRVSLDWCSFSQLLPSLTSPSSWTFALPSPAPSSVFSTSQACQTMP